jgi:DNA-binding CsgD family transcriptional regulator
MHSLPTAADIMSVLGAVYDVEQPAADWLTRLLRELSTTLDLGAGVGGVLYEVLSDNHLRVNAIQGVGVSPDWCEAGLAMHQDSRLVPRIIAGYRSLLCATLPELIIDPQVQQRVRGDYQRHRVSGQIMVNGIDCSGAGCALYLFSRLPQTLSVQRRTLLRSFATHLATAYRLHRQLATGARMAPTDVEAVLTPAGHVAHVAVGAKSNSARQQLENAVRRRERCRDIAASEPERALGLSQGLVEARWTLVDRYESDGRRYILARENAPKPLGPAALSAREQQVVSLAAHGRSNKLIAYELGLAHSTVRVLMARASLKLGTTTRAELIARQRSIVVP